ncbi:MAG: hypothetical protein Q8K55_16440 [Gemmatimonadaceae bacterium]|nr:hypothetical protein [Gemmatimonadaceae bacterium]
MRSMTAVLLAAVFASAAHAQAPTAYTYEFRLDPGNKTGEDVIEGTVRVQGARARVDTRNRGHDSDGSYFLVRDGGRVLYVVHPERGEYEVHDADAFARVVGTAMRAVGPIVRFSVHDVRLDTARLGSGAPVAGRRTQRVQLRQHWTTSIRVMGFVKEGVSGSAVGEYWADPSFPLMRNPLLDIVGTSIFALAASDESFIQNADDLKARLFRGAPLKADIRITAADGEGDADETRLRYEVTSLRVGQVDDGALELPKGYRKTNSRTFKM